MLDTTKIQGSHAESAGRRDLQKEFHLKLREGDTVAAVQFLIENLDLNPAYVAKEALRMSQQCARKLALVVGTQAMEFSRIIQQTSASELLAQLHAEYSTLSDRQKTKRAGGFKRFVEDSLGQMRRTGDETSPETAAFERSVLEGVEKKRVVIDTTGSGGDDLIRTRRTFNADGVAAKAELAKIIGKANRETAALQEVIGKIDELQRLLDVRGGQNDNIASITGVIRTSLNLRKKGGADDVS